MDYNRAGFEFRNRFLTEGERPRESAFVYRIRAWASSPDELAAAACFDKGPVVRTIAAEYPEIKKAIRNAENLSRKEYFRGG